MPKGCRIVIDPQRRRVPGAVLFSVAGSALLLCAMLSLFVGARLISPGTTIDALFQFDGSRDHLIIRELRIPRTLVALAVGAALAVAGALMQGLTRNPLASPETLGVAQGAALAVVLAIYFAGITSPHGYVWFALAGAAAFTVLAYALAGAGRGEHTPVRLALSGAVLATVAASWAATIMTLDRRTLDEARFWLAGSVAGRPLSVLAAVAPFLLVGAVIAVALIRPLDALSLGEDTAVGLGISPVRSRLAGAVAIMLLAGGAVAAAGPLAFIGLAVPHILRRITGPEHRLLLPGCALAGPCLLLLADVLGRILMRPLELEVGIVTAFLGAPVLIALVRYTRTVAQ
jgi:iron complex transport system permease protein